MANKKRILTGDRPTGNLHLGHLVGSHLNRVKLQDEYDTYILLADVQALTDNFDDPEKVRDGVFQVLQDSLAVGIDPEKSTIFLQSAVPQIAELTVFYSNLVTISRLERNPTVKDETKQKAKFKDSMPLGFLMYPVSQAADITVVKGELVPVGEDQLPHIEQTREIVRKFNSIYGHVFPEPKALVGGVARLVGLDGNAKMSKSLWNCIYLKDSREEVRQKVMRMYTDPNRIHPTDHGKVEGNPVFIYHDAFNKNKGEVEDLKKRYETGKVGDVEVKEKLINALNIFLDPIRERRSKYDAKKLLMEILSEGTKKALKTAEETMKEVREAMKIVKLV
ncbi:tryptophan--tRNA ligase [candidate division WWE3 bacterium RIFCSPLOWO2_01_FULL_39_13]|uniref:Tryptophan--tRNA ligase n=1 Tax=candidate division WWE3 bacterium RIFCSPLOWO2_01_FULL_39_13 TaxID=1802624 RepID=A0A1F4V513_UNCKA|nr:MAG: tryptophan--tRNA ligase [candidate division WWE3 bacterium RIFCSPLOWO2_01_FULL_39_13]